MTSGLERWLSGYGAWATLPEDPGLTPSTHMSIPSRLWLQSQRSWCPLLASLGTRHLETNMSVCLCADTRSSKPPILIERLLLKKKRKEKNRDSSSPSGHPLPLEPHSRWGLRSPAYSQTRIFFNSFFIWPKYEHLKQITMKKYSWT